MNMKQFLAFFLLIFLALPFQMPEAHAALSIAPTIVVIEGRQRYADVNLINPSNEAKTYVMGWKFFTMEEGKGTYKNAEGSTTEFDLSKHIVFTPRKITIGPMGVQKIRMALRLNGEPPAPGDYRAHFEMKEVRETPPDTTTGKATAVVYVNVGFSIPVIYRVGESDATAQIGKVTTQVNSKTGRIEAHVPLIKNKSAYGIIGTLEIYHQSGIGAEKLIGEVRNANIFAEITTRNLVVPLTEDRLSGGTLHVVYREYGPEKDADIFDETIVPIGK